MRSETGDTGSNTARTAIIYLRVSTARQAAKNGEAEGYSIPAQRTACIKRARDLSATVVEEYVDAGASARSADRDGLQRMLARLEDTSQPPVNLVIVHKLDRLARDRADDVAILLTIRKSGATLVSVSEQIDETPAGTLMHGIVASFAEFYSKNLSTEAKKGLEEKVRRGGTPGVAPIGYLNTSRRIDGIEVKSVVVDETRAPHIKWAFAQYATGEWSITALCDALEERGLTTRETLKYRGQPLSRAQVHRMLTQPYYKGQIRFKGMLFDGKHDPLVDEVTWQSVQDILAGRRIAGDRSWRHGHFLKGSLVCARCSGKIGYGWSRGKGGRYDYFFCLGRHTGRTDCNLPYLPAAAIEKKIAAIWSNIRFTPKTLDAIESRATADFELLLGQHEQLAAEQRQRLIQLERQKSKLIDAYMADALPVEDLKLRQVKVAGEIADARRLITESDIERTELHRRLRVVLAMLRKARKTYDVGDDKARQLLNTAMFERFEVDSRDNGPTANGWTPQEPLVANAELTEIVDAVLEYHADVADRDAPIAYPTASVSKSPLISAVDRFVVTNDAVLQDSTYAYVTADAGHPSAHPVTSGITPHLTSVDRQLGSLNDGAHTGTTPTSAHLVHLGGLGRYRRPRMVLTAAETADGNERTPPNFRPAGVPTIAAWRWRRDLNPRTVLAVSRFQGECIRPLCHATVDKRKRC
jgi:site-specific DNA recombinase